MLLQTISKEEKREEDRKRASGEEDREKDKKWRGTSPSAIENREMKERVGPQSRRL